MKYFALSLSQPAIVFIFIVCSFFLFHKSIFFNWPQNMCIILALKFANGFSTLFNLLFCQYDIFKLTVWIECYIFWCMRLIDSNNHVQCRHIDGKLFFIFLLLQNFALGIVNEMVFKLKLPYLNLLEKSV